MTGCCFKNLSNAKRLGRAKYICPICGTDVTLALIFMSDTAIVDNEQRTERKVDD